jgi:hypothetical protein
VPPFFGRDEGGVYVALREVYISPLFEVFGQRFEHAREYPFFDPPLKAAVAGLVGRVAFGKVLPGRSGAQYPQDAIENVPRISPGSASAIFPARGIRDEWLQYFSLLLCEVHAPFLQPKGCATEPLYPHSLAFMR